MTQAPKFITFSGIDNTVDVSELRKIADSYPVEFGVLFSPERQGIDQRYPSPDKLQEFIDAGLPLSAHFCGRYSRNIIQEKGNSDFGIPLNKFNRVQINTTYPDPEPAAKYSEYHSVRVILQMRDVAFPADDRVDWLYDPSAGRGLAIGKWPSHPGRLVGYAGGITPNSIVSVIENIHASGDYWLDMETGVRTIDRFDVEKVKAVLKAVYDTEKE